MWQGGGGRVAGQVETEKLCNAFVHYVFSIKYRNHET